MLSKVDRSLPTSSDQIVFPAENLRVFKNSQHPNGDIVLPRVGEKLLISPLVTQQNIFDQTWLITQIDISLYQVWQKFSVHVKIKSKCQLLLCLEFCSQSSDFGFFLLNTCVSNFYCTRTYQICWSWIIEVGLRYLTPSCYLFKDYNC